MYNRNYSDFQIKRNSVKIKRLEGLQNRMRILALKDRFKTIYNNYWIEGLHPVDAFKMTNFEYYETFGEYRFKSFDEFKNSISS